jgi:lipopolysaccharide transport system permease protein
MLGGLWAVLQPLAMMAVFTMVFTRLVKLPSEGVPYALFAYAGILPWNFFSGTVSSATGSLVSHAQLVTKVYFPREILPISYAISAIVDLLIGSVALIALAVFYHVPVTGELTAVLPIVALLGACSLSCGLFLSAVQVRFRDVGIALPIALQLLMFGSPVLYPLSVVPASWRPLYLLNPVAGLIDGFRRSVLGIPLDLQALSMAAVVTALMLPVAYLAFKHAEVTIADVI